jgi:hypothetical protein
MKHKYTLSSPLLGAEGPALYAERYAVRTVRGDDAEGPRVHRIN